MGMKENTEKVGVNLRLEQGRYEAVAEMALEEERSIAQMVNILVREALEQREQANG